MIDGIDVSPGHVTYDELLLDDSRPLSEQLDNLKEDLLQIQFPDGYLVDVGWYPEFAHEGAFTVLVTQDADWSSPAWERHCSSIAELREALTASVRYVRSQVAEKK